MSTGRRARASRRLAPAREPSLYDFLESTIQAPATRPGTVSRTALVNRLRVTTAPASVATVIAPAGYGKTTLLAQWAGREGRPFAWVTLDDRDNDPVVLLRHIAAALDRNGPLEPRVLDALEAPGRSIWTKALPRLAKELAVRGPLVLVLDDFGVLRSRESLDVVAALIAEEPEGSLVAIAGRTSPRLPLASLRAEGRLVELDAADLAMNRREAELLLRGSGVRLGSERTAEVVQRCEGWPAALYLAALAVREGNRTGLEAERISGDDRYLADYFRSEYLSHLRPGPLRFLRRTSLLERMNGSLCDALLQDEGSAQELEKIEHANLFLVPLDNRREWYRYHHLFRDLLRHELAAREPELVPVLHGRAARWFAAHGDDEAALEHLFAAGDTAHAAALLVAIAMPVYHSGRIATVERWLARFRSQQLLERYPLVALQGCVIHALRGRAEEAERWLDAATKKKHRGRLPDGSPSVETWVAVMRAWLCREGVPQMLADAEKALAELPEKSRWRAAALVAQGSALLLLDEPELADAALAAGVELALESGSTEIEAIGLAERALIAADAGEHDLAERYSESLVELVESSPLEGYPARISALVAASREQLRRGRWNEARAALTEARELLPRLTHAVPWLSVSLRLELVSGLVTLRDAESAQEVLDEADEIAARVADLGSLAGRARELRREIAVIPEPDGANHAGLTPAELRLLPLLATHLSFREIAEQLFVSRNTVKTQAISVYRKLGVTSRSEAVAEAQRLGLEEHLRVLVTR
jgi:LuxR family maltose regulon positive regulatory protein